VPPTSLEAPISSADARDGGSRLRLSWLRWWLGRGSTAARPFSNLDKREGGKSEMRLPQAIRADGNFAHAKQAPQQKRDVGDPELVRLWRGADRAQARG